MSKMVNKLEQNRRKMLLQLGRSELLKGDWQRLVSQMGYDSSKRALDPSRSRPPVDNTVDSMRKWVQAALNVVLGTNLKLDGVSGPVTRQALKRFQRREGITAHGYLDETTLQALELRVGVRAPRSEGHEGLPHLMRLPRKGIWKPGRPDDKKKDKKPGSAIDERSEEIPGAAQEVQAGELKPGLLQTEAEHAVRALAFDPEFVGMAAERQAETDLGSVKAGMTQWLDQAMGLPKEDSPAWTDKVRRLARGSQEESASLIRRQWWQEHVEESP